VDDVRRIADAVLYEGYLLWPYRHSALKNQRRWTFGAVHPPAHSREHPDDRCVVRAQCLVAPAAAATIAVTVRFLHVVVREDGCEEATEREITSGPLTVDALLTGSWHAVHVAAGAGEGRRWEGLTGGVAVHAARLSDGLLRVTAEITNTTPFAGRGRPEALRHSFCSAHAVLAARDAHFISLTDPPAALRDAAAACVNDGVWPVLIGAPGSDDTMLASPIILEDHPRIAPESPGDLFDGGEIDQMLVLNILSLTDEERREMRDSDPKAREILERTEALTPEELMRLNGAIRDWSVR
jgi:hydrogenase maturation protease